MTTQTTDRPMTASTSTCDAGTRITRSLLGYGLLAGPVYVGASVAQGLAHEGFDFGRHEWSLLAAGPYGWIQSANLVLTGLMCVAFAVGLRRALATGRAATWSPRLVAVYGLGLIGAGVFRADPRDGYPVGTPDGPGQVTWHGTLHFATAGIGFLAAVAACFVLARRYAAEGRRGFAAYSAATGVAFLAAFGGVASGGGSAAIIIAFTAAVVAQYGWLAVVAVDRYRTVAHY